MHKDLAGSILLDIMLVNDTPNRYKVSMNISICTSTSGDCSASPLLMDQPIQKITCPTSGAGRKRREVQR